MPTVQSVRFEHGRGAAVAFLETIRSMHNKNYRMLES